MSDDKLRESAERVLQELYGFGYALQQSVASLRDALAATADAPPEVTETMVRAALMVETDEGGPVSQDIGFGMMRLMLEAALAAAHEEGK